MFSPDWGVLFATTLDDTLWVPETRSLRMESAIVNPGTAPSGGTQADRFAFGRNWESFSRQLDEERISGAKIALQQLLGVNELSGRTFLDIGCGSGLMSLAAHQMGASVRAFDYDPDSVETTREVRDRWSGPESYEVSQGSVLDRHFVDALGTFDIVYSWGVLHHTGDMWEACQLAADRVAPGGTLAIAIYNDQGLPSRLWTKVKRRYVASGPLGQRTLVLACSAYFGSRHLAILALRNAAALARSQPPVRSLGNRPRGMDRRHDLVDWVGGYPFEVAKPEEIFSFYRGLGYSLEAMTTCSGGLGCNEFRFTKPSVG